MKKKLMGELQGELNFAKESEPESDQKEERTDPHDTWEKGKPSHGAYHFGETLKEGLNMKEKIKLCPNEPCREHAIMGSVNLRAGVLLGNGKEFEVVYTCPSGHFWGVDKKDKTIVDLTARVEALE
jgi:hypothetical protein